jgi:bifunctional non-homologous end joining protein LigD
LYITPALAEPILSTIPAFIEPSAPALRAAPPVGPSWRHEVKFDGWRVQVWKLGKFAELHSRRGHDIGSRGLERHLSETQASGEGASC